MAYSQKIDLGQRRWILAELGASNYSQFGLPASVYDALYENGQVPNPLMDCHEKDLQHLANKTWELSCFFILAPEMLKQDSISLCLSGIDAYAKVFLNGKEILETHSPFISYKIAIKGLIQKKSNVLRIRLLPADSAAKKMYASYAAPLPYDERNFLRRPAFFYGWDWAPKLTAGGLYGKVEISAWSVSKINDWQVFTHVDESLERAKLHSRLLLGNSKKTLHRWEILLLDANGKQVAAKERSINALDPLELKVTDSLEIQNPNLWYPRGKGKQELYTCIVRLYDKDGLRDERRCKLGFRHVEWVQENDEQGSSFYVKINKKPVFALGANWVPPVSAFEIKEAPAKTKQLLDLAAAANINMLRVWGGGFYPENDFYERCDSLGILVWQDFMFACALYPTSKDFIKLVKTELRQQIGRLGSHPSLVIWCGNNEVNEGWHNWGWQKQFSYSEAQQKTLWDEYQYLFEKLIPAELAKLLPYDFYWPSSPSYGWGKKESMFKGDSHYWGVWWGMEPFEKYKEKVPRFMSEFGFQGYPSLPLIRKYFANAVFPLQKDSVFACHQKHPKGFQTIQEYRERDFPAPRNLIEEVYLSQLLQAYGMCMGIEAQRASKPYCMGSLFWQFNDAWPSISWSCIDYMGKPKALYFKLKEYFAPVFLSFRLDKNALKIGIVNDSLAEKKMLNVSLCSYEGEEKPCFASLCKSSELATEWVSVPFSHGIDTARSYVRIRYGDKKRIVHLAKPKDRILPKPNLTIEKHSYASIKVTAHAFCADVFLFSKKEGLEFVGENFVDMEKGETRVFKLNFLGKWDVDDIEYLSLNHFGTL